MPKKSHAITCAVFVLMGMLLMDCIAGYAETRYVSDVLVITMREGQGDEFKVVRTLRSNTPLEVLDETEEYLYVRTGNGEEGWVRKRYTTSETPKSMVIESLNAEVLRLKKTIEDLEKDKSRLWEELTATKEDYLEGSTERDNRLSAEKEKAARVQEELSRLKTSYQTLLDNSSNVVELVDKVDKLEQHRVALEKKAAQLVAQVDALNLKNRDLFRFGIARWFLYGAGVLILGMIMGKMSRRKEYY